MSQILHGTCLCKKKFICCLSEIQISFCALYFYLLTYLWIICTVFPNISCEVRERTLIMGVWKPEFNFWFCPLLVLRPQASYSSFTCKKRPVNTY